MTRDQLNEASALERELARYEKLESARHITIDAQCGHPLIDRAQFSTMEPDPLFTLITEAVRRRKAEIASRLRELGIS